MKDTQMVEDGLSNCSLDLISHLKPVSVVAADEESLDTTEQLESEVT